MALIRTICLVCAGTSVAADTGLPNFLQEVGGAYALTDQSGAVRTQADPDGRSQLLFFGYANCQQICSSVLPQMADVADALADTGRAVTPMMITVDPVIDTIAEIGPALVQYHPDFIGLTGSDAALQVAYDAFQIEKEFLFEDPEYGPVYAHGSFLYLMDGAGAVLTIIPPVLSDEEIVTIISNYIPAG
jgi:protein SCO1/2